MTPEQGMMRKSATTRRLKRTLDTLIEAVASLKTLSESCQPFLYKSQSFYLTAWGILPTASSARLMADVFLARQCKNGLVKVIIGDITESEVDVMVTTANNRLAGQEGVDAKIHTKAGE